MNYPKPGSLPSSAYIDPTVPDLPHPGETTADDLATRMFGQPMPNPQRIPDPNATSTLHSLGWDERETIRQWIDEGAPACPCKKADEETGVCPPTGGDAGSDAGADSSADAGSDTTVDASDGG